MLPGDTRAGLGPEEERKELMLMSDLWGHSACPRTTALSGLWEIPNLWAAPCPWLQSAETV